MCEADIKILWQKVVLRLVVVQLLPWPSLWYIISLSSLYNILRLVILKLRPWLPLFATNTQNCITVGYPASSSVATIICHKYKNHLPQMQKIVLQLVIVQLLSWPPLGTGSNNQNGNSRWFFPWRGRGSLEFHIWLNCYCWGNSSIPEGRFSKWF